MCNVQCSDEESYVLSSVRIPGWSWRVVTQFLAAASVLVQAGLLATCLSSDLGWVSCTVHTVLYSTVHCTQLAAVSSPVSRLSPTITLSWTLAAARSAPASSPAMLLVTTGDCQLQIVKHCTKPGHRT